VYTLHKNKKKKIKKISCLMTKPRFPHPGSGLVSVCNLSRSVFVVIIIWLFLPIIFYYYLYNGTLVGPCVGIVGIYVSLFARLINAHFNGVRDEPWARQPADVNYYAYRNYFANQFFFCFFFFFFVLFVPTYRDRST